MATFKDKIRKDMRVFEHRMTTATDELNEMWGNLANKMGTLVEDIISPNVRGVAEKYLSVHSLGPLTVGCDRRIADEPDSEHWFDVVASSDSRFFIVVAAATTTNSYTQRFVALLPRLPEYSPEAGGREFIPIFSALRASPDAVKYLTRHGVYCMVIGGGSMVLTNFDEVRARRRVT